MSNVSHKSRVPHATWSKTEIRKENLEMRFSWSLPLEFYTEEKMRYYGP